MPNLLVIGELSTALAQALPAQHLAVLAGGKHEVLRTDSEAALRLKGAFGGTRPDALLVDLETEASPASLKTLRNTLKSLWQGWADVPILGFFGPSTPLNPDLALQVDEFILAPSSPEELNLRIEHLLRRTGRAEEGRSVRVADLTIDFMRHEARDSQGTRVALTAKEIELMKVFCAQRGRYFGRDELASLVWGHVAQGAGRSVDIHICRLRSKLPSGAARCLSTLRGVGYGLSEEEGV